MEELAIGPGTMLRVVAEDEQALELEATYVGGGAPPPAHLHPAQDEHFEILEGTMRALVAGQARTLGVGETLDIPRGTVHQMWNEGEAQAIVSWRTTPAGRTLDWFRELAAAVRGEGREDPSTLLADYSDVFRLAEQ